MNLFRKLSPRAHLTIGLTGLLVSIVLTAALLGLVPDRVGAVRDGRIALSEIMAANASMLATMGRPEEARAALALAVQRNADLHSAALRNVLGEVAVAVGDHSSWEILPDEHSTSTQLRVPIMQGRNQWGELELRFEPLQATEGLLQFFDNAWIKLALYVALVAFAAFYVYLGRMLRQLDPTQAVPSRVRSALDTMAEGLLVLDTNANIVLANTSFAELLEREPEALVGRRARELPWRDDEGEALLMGDEPWLDTLETGKASRHRTLRLQTSTDTHTFMVNCTPVLGEGRSGGGVLVSFDDVTQLEEKEIELRKAKLEAEAANEAKSSFLANMSHEIRTPMNAILGFTEVLKRGQVQNPTESLRYLNTIHSSGRHLLDLINDILDLSKVEAGRMEVETARFPVHVMLLETLETLRVRATEKDIALELEPPETFPETIESDPARLRQIVTNLVGNAIKFTAKGGVKVRPRVDYQDGRARLQVDVVDTGIGMTPEQQAKIFDPFVQADSSVTRKFGGTGLGLAISKRLAGALNGDIVITSEMGKGSTFSIEVDAGDVADVHWIDAPTLMAAATRHAEVESDGVWQFPPVRALVVDDGVENRQLLQLVLGDVGFDIVEAENGKEGLDLALAEPFDIVLMDVNMPVMDGYDAARAMREGGVRIPILALTADAMKGVEERLLEAGFTEYLTKPIAVEPLLRTLAGYLDGYQVASDQADSPADVVETSAPQATGSPEGGTAPIPSTLLASNPRAKPIVEKFISELDDKLGELRAAAESGDFESARSISHWLRGTGGTLGFGALNEPTHTAERAAQAADQDTLRRSVEVIVQLGRRLTAEPGSGVVEATATLQRPAVVRSRMHGIARMRPILERFAGELERRLGVMRTALDSGDLATLGDEAHWLKGAGGTVGFDDFTDPAGELQNAARGGQRDASATLLARVEALGEGAIASLRDEEAAQPETV